MDLPAIAENQREEGGTHTGKKAALNYGSFRSLAHANQVNRDKQERLEGSLGTPSPYGDFSVDDKKMIATHKE